MIRTGPVLLLLLFIYYIALSLTISFCSSNGVDTYDYIRSTAGEQLVDRIYDMTKDFPDVAEIGCNAGYLTRHELPDSIKRYRLCDSSDKMLKQAKLSTIKSSIDFSYHQMDEETPNVRRSMQRSHPFS